MFNDTGLTQCYFCAKNIRNLTLKFSEINVCSCLFQKINKYKNER